MTFIKIAVEQHYRTLAITNGELAKYRRHDDDKVYELTLIPALADLSEFDAGLSAQMQDWLILVSDFVALVGRLPEPLDQIDVGDTPARITYQVVHGTESRPWQYTDQSRLALRIHTVETAPHQE